MKYFKIILFFFALTLMSMNCNPDPPDDPDLKYDPVPYQLVLPEGFPLIEFLPAENPMTEEGVALGRKLFYDPILSGDGSQSCASCHLQESSFTDPTRFSIGIDGSQGVRNAMHVVNAVWQKDFFWDGRAKSLEDQALEPVENPIEMKNAWEKVVADLQADAAYPDLFFKAFGEKEINKELAAKAIAQFERTMISANSRFDSVMRNETFFTEQELRGFELFNSERGDCFHCHVQPMFTDNLFHNNGLDLVFEDEGLFEVTGFEFDKGKFKTPGLRNVSLTAPYMHDGRFNTLKEVVDFYSDSIQAASPTLDPLMNHQGGIFMTEEEKLDLIAFLHTLTDTTFINNRDFSNPF